MRIAALVYGRLQFCDTQYNNILEQIGKVHEIDFFMSSDNSPKEQLDSFLNLYKPVYYTNEPIQHDFNLDHYPGKREETNLDPMIRHFINKYRVFSMLENYPVNYDVVISLRIDLEIQSPFLLEELEENTIYIPEGYDYVINGINDQIAYGKKEVLKKYNMIVTNITALLDNNWSIPHPESLTYANIVSQSILIKRVGLTYYIVRN